MTAMTVGPFLIPGDRLTVLIAGAFLVGAGALLTRLVDRRIGEWSAFVVPLAVVAARLAHVASAPDGFWREPFRIFAIWDGGMSWWAGVVASIIFTVVKFRDVRMRAWALGTLAATLFVWNVAWQLAAATPAIAAPVATLPTLGGEQKSLTDFNGRPTVVNLWATWCPPCRREMPMLVEAAKERRDLSFVFANQGEGPAQILAYMASSGLNIQNVLLDQFRSLSQHYSIKGYPATVFLDSKGLVRKIHYGEITREALDVELTKLTEARAAGAD